MIKRFWKVMVFLLIVPLAVAIAFLMKSGATGIEVAGDDFRDLALKMALLRVIVIGGVCLFGWRVVSRFVGSYFRVDVERLKYRVLCWYLVAECAVIGSLFWT